MRTLTIMRASAMLLLVMGLVGLNANAQRTVTLTLNAASTADTTLTDSFFEVRGAADGVSPATLADGNIIDWSDASTLNPVNIGGDYYQVQFQIADTTNLTFKFFSGALQDNSNIGEGWEADPNPMIAAGTGDTTLTVHFFESQREYRGVSGDRGPYGWRPWETKEDTVAVWFRVYANTSDGILGGYVPGAEAPDQQIGVRGDDFAASGPLDWGNTKVLLTREATNPAAPGYNIYSGVGYYANALVGTEQNYKFVVDNEDLTDGTLGWESFDGNRTFTVPAEDSTLAWQFFGNTPAATANAVTSDVLFAVNLDAFESIGLFRKSRGDTLQVRGGFNGWGCDNPDLCLLQDVPATNDFEAAVTLTLLPQAEIAYKFFLDFNNAEFVTEFGKEPPSGWEEGYKTGVNRVVNFAGTPEQDLGLSFFNEIESRNVIPEGSTINVNFSVDMSSTSANRPFDASAGDSLIVELKDPIWAFTQGVELLIDGGDDDRPDIIGMMTDDDQDGIYTGTLAVEGPTYGLLTYVYKYGQRTAGVFEGYTEAGTGQGNIAGRNRARFIQSNPDGSWPSEYTLAAEVFTAEGALPFEANTVAVEQTSSELPESVTLLGNYPNPFSSSTSFDYTLTEKTEVTISVYNVIGQRVATVVDAVQPAGTFKANFEAGTLSSGTYFVRLETPNTAITRSIVLVK